jgi:hypothetical protein
MARPHIAVIVGSNRRASINRKLAQALVKLGADKFDATFLRIDDLPMFNQDLEANLPAEVIRFKAELTNADGILIVTPEVGTKPWGGCSAFAMGGAAFAAMAATPAGMISVASSVTRSSSWGCDAKEQSPFSSPHSARMGTSSWPSRSDFNSRSQAPRAT